MRLVMRERSLTRLFALAARHLAVLLLHRRDRHHPPCPRSPRNQPRNRRINIAASNDPSSPTCARVTPQRLPMDDMHLDPARNEPARQPEAIAASLIGQRNPADRPASTTASFRHRWINHNVPWHPAPVSSTAGARRREQHHSPASSPCWSRRPPPRWRSDQRGQASAEIIDLGHGATSIGWEPAAVELPRPPPTAPSLLSDKTVAPSPTAHGAQARVVVRARSARKGARVDGSHPPVA